MDETSMQHGRHWCGQNPRGWLASEKFRGARAYWDGATLWSRGGTALACPAAWRAALPAGFPLDGEVWAGRGPEGGPHEVEAAQAVTHSRFTPRLRFLVFDAPGATGPWAHRMRLASLHCPPASVLCAVGFEAVRSLPHLEALFARVAAKGGEGLMLRRPQADYAPGRTGDLLKVKLDPALSRGVVRVF